MSIPSRRSGTHTKTVGGKDLSFGNPPQEGFDASGNPDSGVGNNGEVVLAQGNVAFYAMACGPQGTLGVVGASSARHRADRGPTTSPCSSQTFCPTGNQISTVPVPLRASKSAL